MIFKASIMSNAIVVFSCATAMAGSSLEFLKNMDGKFRGRGKVMLESSVNRERISCRIENIFDAAQQYLVMSGECATALGKTSVQGKIIITDGDLSGSFIAPFPNSEMTESGSEFIEDKLVISASFISRENGKTWRVRQIVSAGDSGGFHLLFQGYDFSSNSYEDIGDMVFSRSDN